MPSNRVKKIEKDVGFVKKAGFFVIAALALCAAALMTVCGTQLSEVFLQMHGSALFLGL